MYFNNPKKYREIEHTADVGIWASGKNLSEVFANAAFAMRYILFGDIEIAGNQSRRLKLVESHLNDLMVGWLSELNFQLTIKEFIISNIEKLHIETKKKQYYLYAQLRGQSSQAYLSHLNNEIKAVTYHDVEIRKGPAGYAVRVVLDV